MDNEKSQCRFLELSSRLGSPLTPTKGLNFPFGNEHSSLLCLILVLLAGYQVLWGQRLCLSLSLLDAWCWVWCPAFSWCPTNGFSIKKHGDKLMRKNSRTETKWWLRANLSLVWCRIGTQLRIELAKGPGFFNGTLSLRLSPSIC